MKYKLIIIFLLFTSTIYSQVLPIQGKLIENNIAVSGNVNFDFEILKNNVSIWTESQNGIIVTNGLYTVNLGSINNIPQNIFDNVDFVKLIIKANNLLVDTIDIFSPIESDPTIPSELKDGIDWIEIQNKPTVDQDTTNEIQLLSFQNDSLRISNGNSIAIPILSDSINLVDGLSVGSLDTSQNIIIDQSGSTSSIVATTVWQSFILSEDLKLLKLIIKMANINNTDIRLRIFSGIGNSSQPIYTPANIPANDISPLLEFKEISITPPFVLNAGENYTFEITGINNDILVNMDTSNPYLYGTSSEGAQNDLTFKIMVEQISTYLLSVTDQVITLNAPEINLHGRVKDKSGFITPVGAIVAYAGTTPPEGWLLCDGSTVSRAVYDDLFLILGESWGEGDANSTFNLPDMRGRFLRGVDGTADEDPDKDARTALFSGGNTGNNIGTYQEDAFQGHQHLIKNNQGHFIKPANLLNGGIPGAHWNNTYNSEWTFNATDIISNDVDGEPKVSSETRAKNAYVNYIIKY